MTRVEALDKANEIVDEWVNAVRNERGYVHDKWQPVDPEKRTDAVLRVAEFLLAGAPEARPANLVGPAAPPHLHRASCHGPIGELMCDWPADGPTISG